MGSKVIILRFSSPLLMKGDTVIRSIVYVDEARGERAIDKIKKAVEKQYEDKLFVKGQYALAEIETIWED